MHPGTAAGGGFVHFVPPEDTISSYDVPPTALLASDSSPPGNASVETPVAAPSPRQPPAAAAHHCDKDIVLGYINRLLMTEDLDDRFEHHPDHPALLAAERPFREILGESLPPPPDEPAPEFLQQPKFDGILGSESAAACGGDMSSQMRERGVQSQAALQFRQGLALDLETPRRGGGVVHEARKHPHAHDLDAEEGRSSKQSAVDAVSIDLIRGMRKVLLCDGIKEARDTLQHAVARHAEGPKRGRGKRQPKEVVDLETLLTRCAHAVAKDAPGVASELLSKIRQHASPKGDATQRLAHCFADGLEARLAGNGSHIYRSITTRQYASTDVLKAYKLFLAACPFKKISHFFSYQTILNTTQNAKKIHIIDYGIQYGFHWPCLLQQLSYRPEGPPKLRITAIDTPQRGLRPSERMDVVRRCLMDYTAIFGISFEFRAVLMPLEAVRIEDLRIEEDEVLIVHAKQVLHTLMDETVAAEAPRSRVLDTIRRMNPHVFIHCATNGAYSEPFFVARFQKALLHYSAIFDMLDANIPRDNEARMLIEAALIGTEVINVIACEGLERTMRPETYKQLQVRHQRAGLKQLPLDREILRRARGKLKCYHKDYVVDEDSQWLLIGWKGRILYALSTWKSSGASS